jgi:hypothetical protein
MYCSISFSASALIHSGSIDGEDFLDEDKTAESYDSLWLWFDGLVDDDSKGWCKGWLLFTPLLLPIAWRD